MIYTLIMTLHFFSSGSASNPSQYLHFERDYESAEACHAAFAIAQQQAIQIAYTDAKVVGTCLSHGSAKL